jgi:hypothetical protein
MTNEQDIRHRTVAAELSAQRNSCADMAAQLAGELAVWNARWNDIETITARLAELEEAQPKAAEKP